jgi:MFS family permease
LTLLPLSLSVVLGAALAAALLRRRPPRQAIALGLATIAVGDAALLAVGAGMWVLVAAPAVAGLGLGVAAVGATTLGTDVGASAQGAAVGAVNTAAQLGTAIGVAVLLLVAGGSVSTSPPRLAWACAAVTAALAAGIFSRGGTRGRPAVADRGSGRAHGLRHDVRPGG